MVFFGLPLPAANNAIRMANLNIALKNDQIKLLSTVNNINQNVKNPPEVIQAKVENLINLSTPSAADYLNQMQTSPVSSENFRTTETPMTVKPLTSAKRVSGINLDELKTKLNAPNRGLKTIPGPPPVQRTSSGESEAPSMFSGTAEVLPAVSVSPSDISNISAENQENYNNIKNDINFDLEKIDSEDGFKNFVSKWLKRKLPLIDRLTAKQPGLMLPYLAIKPKNSLKFHELKPGNAMPPAFQNAWPLFQKDKNKYIDMVNQELVKSFMIHGAGLFKSSRSLSTKRSPNFGNLWLNEKALKKNTLSIMRPYSNIYEVTAKSISNLLKKMIIDISNTLEFDIKDYENLESEEKKIIERIINKQKDMKNYNIKNLIGDDINKSRKRLDILFGEINSGNNSSLVFSEALDLLKSLFQNGAIAHTKYNNLRRAIQSHME